MFYNDMISRKNNTFENHMNKWCQRTISLVIRTFSIRIVVYTALKIGVGIKFPFSARNITVFKILSNI